ncbi:hypothetical protein [Pseudomonas solani]|uniref:hypothetical protein n=1 Tax=Pseudomonas solani TaxID=2731552 RepID=UPI003D6A1E17
MHNSQFSWDNAEPDNDDDRDEYIADQAGYLLSGRDSDDVAFMPREGCQDFSTQAAEVLSAEDADLLIPQIVIALLNRDSVRATELAGRFQSRLAGIAEQMVTAELEKKSMSAPTTPAAQVRVLGDTMMDTFVALCEYLGIDPMEAAKLPGKPSEVFIAAIEARAALSAPPAAGVPEGWRLVPVEPTPEMLEAGDGYLGTPATYKTMLSAAPQPPYSMPITAEFSQFLSAVMDAAGLVRHGRRSKELSEYLGQQCMKYRAGFAPTPPASEQQQAVVLPERAVIKVFNTRQSATAIGWNDCLNELLRLNPHLAGVNQGVTTEAGNGGGE